VQPHDFIFPAMSANGIVHPGQPISHDTVQKWINESTAGAGILGNFSTHCFRRGGAQYWFMFAPVGQRWTLAKVRWWGWMG
jgi:integrase